MFHLLQRNISVRVVLLLNLLFAKGISMLVRCAHPGMYSPITHTRHCAS